MQCLQRIGKTLDQRIVLIILALLAVLWIQAPRLTDEFKVIEDFASFHWMNKFQEPGLFPNDQLRGDTYITVHLLGGDLPLYFPSLGYDLLFYVASFLVSPILFTKILPFLLAAVTVWYLFAYGTAVRDRGTGTILAIGFLFLNLAAPNSLSLTTGLQRSFASPLIIALLYYLHHRVYSRAMVVVVLSALFYAPVFLLATAAWGIVALEDRKMLRRKRVIKKAWVYLLIAFIIGVAVLSPVVLPKFSDAFITAEETPSDPSEVSYKHIWEDPRYRVGGRRALFKLFPIRGRAGLITKKEMIPLLFLLLSVSALFCLVLRRDAFDIPLEIWGILQAGLGLFIVAWIGIYLTNSFLLYLPSRYSRVGLFLFFSMFVLLNLKASVEEGARLMSQDRKYLIAMVGVIGVLVGFVFLIPTEHRLLGTFRTKPLFELLTLFLVALTMTSIRISALPSASESSSSKSIIFYVLIGAIAMIGLITWADWSRDHSGTLLDPSPDERKMLNFLQTLPKDILIGGTPCTLDSVPVFAKRQVIFNCEMLPKDDDLVRGALNAYYAEDPRQVIDFCQAYEVNYLVIDAQTYTQAYIDAGDIFFDPYNQELLPLIRSRDTFVLAHVPDEAKVFQLGDLFVVPCTEAALLR